MNPSKSKGIMLDKKKLHYLAVHWITHSMDHATEYRRWADAMEDAGEDALAAALRKVVAASEALTRELNGLFQALGPPGTPGDFEDPFDL